MRLGVLTGFAIGALALVGVGYAIEGKRTADGSGVRPASAVRPPEVVAPPRSPVPGAPVVPRDRAQRLHETLSSLVTGPLGRMRVGVRVMDVASGRVLFGERDDVLMDPASNQKVLATATALLRLGGGWQFHTELTGPPPDGEGTIVGDVLLRGNGDPSLRRAHLEEMAAQLAARGVTRITGSVLGDPRRIGADETGPGERPPLRVGRAALEIRIRPADHEGAVPLVTVRPSSETVVIDNRARTGGRSRGKIVVSASASGGRLRVSVSGRISLLHPGMVMRRVPSNPPLYAAILLRSALQQAGITVTGPAGLHAPKAREPRRTALAGRTSDTPLALEPAARPTILASHESDALPILMRRINKDSDNEWAERLLESVGAEIYGGPATAPKGQRALREAIAELGLPPREYVSVNGSGLGHANRISAVAMADLLRRLFLDPRLGPDMLQSFSVGGIDGTTRNRFRGSPAAERVRAKTGTLKGKSCLAGYVGDGSDILAFSIMVQGLRGVRSLGVVRQAQVTAVNAMMRYARGATTPLDDTVPAGVDFETGQELADTEGESEETDATSELEPPAVAADPAAAAAALRPAPAPPPPPPPPPERPAAAARSMPAPRTGRRDNFEETVRKAFKQPLSPEESFDQKVDKAFKEFERRAPRVKKNKPGVVQP